eukprot:190952_1
MFNKTLILVLFCMVYCCQSACFYNLTDELGGVAALLSPTDSASFAQVSKACGDGVKYQEELENQMVLKLISILSNITSDTFPDGIQMIKPLAFELIYNRRSKVFFKRLGGIMHAIKTDLRHRLKPHQIRDLFRALNVYSANKYTFVAEGRHESSNRTIEQLLLTIASRGIAHALVPSNLLPNVNESAHLTPPYDDDDTWMMGSFSNWRSDSNNTDPDVFGAWVYTLAVMYEHWIAHYHNASDNIQQIMVQQYHFIPWPSSVITRLKAAHVHYLLKMRVVPPFGTRMVFNPWQTFRQFLTTPSIVGPDQNYRDAVSKYRIYRFYSKWILDFFQFQLDYLATNNTDLEYVQHLNDLVHNQHGYGIFIVDLAFANYLRGDYKEYEQLMDILGNPLLGDTLQCIMPVICMYKWQYYCDLTRSFSMDEQLEFVTKSLLRLKAIRADWNDHELAMQNFILDVTFLLGYSTSGWKSFNMNANGPCKVLIDLLNDTFIFGNKTRIIQSIRTFVPQSFERTLECQLHEIGFKNALVRYLNLSMQLF